MQCVVLAGGLGTRMQDVAPGLPKCLIEVAGRPFADLQLTWLAAQQATDVIYCIGHLGAQVREYVGDGTRWGLSVSYVDEKEQLRGTAGALRLAYDLNMLEKRFFVLYGDSFLTVDLSQVRAAHVASNCPALMTVFRNEGLWEKSNAVFDGRRVTCYEKHRVEPPSEMRWVDYGLSSVSRHMVAEELPAYGTSDLADLFHRLSRAQRLAGFEVFDRFFEVGSPAGLVELEQYLAQ